jgi:hypothetical protein
MCRDRIVTARSTGRYSGRSTGRYRSADKRQQTTDQRQQTREVKMARNLHGMSFAESGSNRHSADARDRVDAMQVTR